MFYTGSTATYRYHNKSDIDIHIIVDWTDLLKYNPDKERTTPEQVWQDLHDTFWWTLNKKKLPGTKHPLQYYIIKPGHEKEILEPKEEIYDIGHDVWIIPPKEIVNLEEDVIAPAIEEADEFMNRIDEHISDARKGLIDYELLSQMVKITPNNAGELFTRLSKKLEEIDIHLKALKEEYAKLKEKRREAFEKGESLVSDDRNYSIGNIIYKLVERYKYMDVLRKIKRITDDMDLQPDQAGEVAEALGLINFDE
jgi:hypothetical protein